MNLLERRVLIFLLLSLFVLVGIRYFQERSRKVEISVVHDEVSTKK